MVERQRTVDRYDEDGVMTNGKYVEPNPYSDNVILLHYVTQFIDSYELKNMEFLKYKGFNAVRVTITSDYIFYVTVNPIEKQPKEILEL